VLDGASIDQIKKLCNEMDQSGTAEYNEFMVSVAFKEHLLSDENLTLAFKKID